MNRLGKDEIIIIDDEAILIDGDEDSVFSTTSLDPSVPHGPSTMALIPKRMPSCVSLLVLSDDEPSSNMPQPQPTNRAMSTEPQFRTPDYGPRGSYPTNRMSCVRSPKSLQRPGSSPGILQGARKRGADGDLGISTDPISFDFETDDAPPTSGMRQGRRSSGFSGQHQSSDGEWLGSDVSGTFLFEKEDPRLSKNLAQNLGNVAVIGLDELEDDLEDELRILSVQDIQAEAGLSHAPPKPAKFIKIRRRNPSIAAPWITCSSYQHRKMKLMPKKTVELIDGDFLRIREIIFNIETQEARVRGNRLQRTRDFNGVLEMKMNELVLFLEVDLDDPRSHLEQGAVEYPLSEIKKIRSLRLTNQKFPLDRNLELNEFRNRLQVNLEGGLTCRWKYTCIYATGADRHQNVYKERRVERIRPEECTSPNVLSDTGRRFQWRGETVTGGAYRPLFTEVQPRSSTPIAVSVPTEIDLTKPEKEATEPPDLQTPISALLKDQGEKSKPDIIKTQSKEKRRHNAVDLDNSMKHEERPKRPRRGSEKDVEETRRRLSTCKLHEEAQPAEVLDSSMVLGVSTNSEDASEPKTANQARDLSRSGTPSISQPVDLMSSDCSTPPPSGSIQFLPRVPPKPVHRLPGQKLTYGDGFCGGGGSTRGALMAGLHIKWGFDFNKHACASWRANFPTAECYNEFSHKFVSRVQHSPNKDDFKVDILHLSPPCQYFSPAHTMEGQDDEMNVASLFAVGGVIEAARPRVVTLEQTFGIVSERFRWFFNALVQMFTSHDFSVRWAIIPLQQWGLPQRRLRLIIIASCPGEILPNMPEPTHMENPPPGSTIKPHVSVTSILKSIPFNAPDHDPISVMFTNNKRLVPYDASKILPRAMTTSGGQNYHPSGKRDFTLREYACLQGFPICHVFRGSHVKKQIGNAVPPVVAKVLFESVKRDLDRADGIVEGVEVLD